MTNQTSNRSAFKRSSANSRARHAAKGHPARASRTASATGAKFARRESFAPRHNPARCTPKAGAARSSTPGRCDIQIESVETIYEDEALIAVNKPARLPMHANLDSQRDHLVGVLTRQLERRDGEPGYLGLHQRLDWGTSGVVVFTRSKAVNAAIAAQFASHSLTKKYWALVSGERFPEHSSWRVAIPLGEPLRKGGPVQLGGPQAQAAATQFHLGQQRGTSAWVEARLETGRKHQIRAHLASCGLYIYGDDLYGNKCAWRGRHIDRTMLHAAELVLTHPLSGQKLHLQATIPDDMRELAGRLQLNSVPLD